MARASSRSAAVASLPPRSSQAGCKQLERNHSVELRVARLVDDPHRARPEPTPDLEALDPHGLRLATEQALADLCPHPRRFDVPVRRPSARGRPRGRLGRHVGEGSAVRQILRVFARVRASSSFSRDRFSAPRNDPFEETESESTKAANLGPVGSRRHPVGDLLEPPGDPGLEDPRSPPRGGEGREGSMAPASGSGPKRLANRSPRRA